MRKEEVVRKIKKYFSSTNIQVIEVENVMLIDPKELKESEYDKFSNFLESLYFLSINIWEDKLSDFWDYRSYAGFEEFENDDGDKVTVYYTKVSTNEGTVYYIEKIRVEERSKEAKTSD